MKKDDARQKAEEELRKCIRTEAEARGYRTQTEIAALLNVTPQYVCDMMNGRRKWGADRLGELADKLRLPNSCLFKWHRLGATADGWRIV